MVKENYIILNSDVNSKGEAFEFISKLALENKLITSEKELINAFEERENQDSTAFENAIAIPHARTKSVKNAGVFFMRFNKPIIWDVDNHEVDCAIFLVIPEGKGDYLDILSGIATKLMDKEIVKKLKNTKDEKDIVQILSSQSIQKQSNIVDGEALTVVGITACATGVAHTYMARDAILDAAKKMNWNAFVETQGQKGPEFNLTEEQIEKADAVILAVDIAVDTDRFAGKKVYKVGTKTLINDPETHVRYSVSKGTVMSVDQAASGVFDVKNNKAWIGHIMSGVSFMIPFIVFAGIIFAVVTGLGKVIFGTWLDYSGAWDNTLQQYVQNGVHVQTGGSLKYLTEIGVDANGLMTYSATIHGYGIATLFYLNSFAGIGFTVMIPVMGAYIANSIAGRSAITPAFVLTWLGSNPKMWLLWGPFADQKIVDLFPGNGAGIFGALLYGFAIGYFVKWINTKWKINKFIQPIMPIIIIPVFVSLIFGLPTLFLLGEAFGYVMGYVNYGLKTMETNQVGMAGLGLLLGLLAGVDMGGPVNKIASFGATALLFTDGGKAMGAASAAFAIAPMGAGISTFLFKNKFKNDRALGVNATILGFMGISEGAIPFAVKYTWAAIIPNIIGSGIAGMCAGLFHVSGWVGAWGGPIIALFGGVTTWDMSYWGILWYLLAIAIGIAVHIIIFRILVEIQSKGGKLSKEDFKKMFTSAKKDKTKALNK